MPWNRVSLSKGFSISITPASAARRRTSLEGCVVIRIAGRSIFALAQLDEQVEAVHLRQLVVDHQAAVRRKFALAQQVRAGGKGPHREALHLQCEFERIPHRGVVVDDQHRRLRQ